MMRLTDSVNILVERLTAAGGGLIAKGRSCYIFVLGVEKNTKNDDGAMERMEQEGQERREVFRRGVDRNATTNWPHSTFCTFFPNHRGMGRFVRF